MSLLEAEKRRWRAVLKRLVTIVQSLARWNFIRTKWHQPDNGHFLKEVELLANFDPVMQQYIARVQSAVGYHPCNLWKTVQNELIAAMSDRVMTEIVTEIKAAQYFSTVLDCPPDLSHQEQTSAIIRTVVSIDMPEINEHFTVFLVADGRTNESLANLILKKLKEHNLPFGDCRGQAYDNGKHKSAQARLLEVNPRAFLCQMGHILWTWLSLMQSKLPQMHLVTLNTSKWSVDSSQQVCKDRQLWQIMFRLVWRPGQKVGGRAE